MQGPARSIVQRDLEPNEFTGPVRNLCPTVAVHAPDVVPFESTPNRPPMIRSLILALPLLAAPVGAQTIEQSLGHEAIWGGESSDPIISSARTNID